MRTNRTAAMAATLAIVSSPGQPVTAQVATSSFLTNPNIQIEYLPPTESQYIPQAKLLADAKKWLEEHQVLERFGQLIAPLRLPQRLKLTAKTCNEPNAFYDRNDVNIVICYELIPDIRLLAFKQQVMNPKEGTNKGVVQSASITRADVEAGGLAFAVLHEAGHMAFHLFNIPVFGRNEDAADQVGAYLALKFSSALSQRLIKGGAGFLYGLGNDSRTLSQFADEHGSPTQRFSNVFCMAYGHSPDAYQYVVAPQLLPKKRADGCVAEYRQVEWAFAKTIEPHLDLEKVKALRSRQESLATWFK